MRDNVAPHTLAEQGIAALKVGNKIQAAELLKKSLLLDPDQELAWLWLSGAVSSQGEQKFCIQNVTRINPQNQAARRGLDSLPANIPAISPFPIQANPHPQPTVILPLQPPPIPHTPHTVAENWFYTLNGQRIGPVKDVDFPRLITTANVDRNTMVWTQGFSEWMPLEQTKLVSFFTAPPPLTGKAVNNTIIWILAFAPLIGVFLTGFFSVILKIPVSSLWFVTLILNLLLCMIDERKLKKAGHDTWKMGTAWFIPVYLYKRASILKQSKAYFAVWIIVFIISLF